MAISGFALAHATITLVGVLTDMAETRPISAVGFAPRLLTAPRAAQYIGVSESKLRTLQIPRKVLDGKRLWDRLELDAYVDNLATEGDRVDENGGW